MTMESVATAAYLVAALLFIMSLAGLSKHESAKSGIWYGIAGMVIAVVATIGLAVSETMHSTIGAILMASRSSWAPPSASGAPRSCR